MTSTRFSKTKIHTWLIIRSNPRVSFHNATARTTDRKPLDAFFSKMQINLPLSSKQSFLPTTVQRYTSSSTPPTDPLSDKEADWVSATFLVLSSKIAGNLSTFSTRDASAEYIQAQKNFLLTPVELPQFHLHIPRSRSLSDSECYWTLSISTIVTQTVRQCTETQLSSEVFSTIPNPTACRFSGFETPHTLHSLGRCVFFYGDRVGSRLFAVFTVVLQLFKKKTKYSAHKLPISNFTVVIE